MIAISSIAETRSIPSAPPGWFDYGYKPLSDDRLALIRTRIDVHAQYQQWLTTAGSEGPDLPLRTLWNDELRLSVFDGEAETEAVMVPSGSFPIVDRMADGRWLVASARAANGEVNARIYSAKGAEEQAFPVGDGIANLLCAQDGTIWVGYFDEGIFKAQNEDGSWPVSSGGIVQFDAKGNRIWSFNDHVHNRRFVADVDAMTLSGDVLWACYHTDYPVVRVERGEPTFWANDMTGADVLAVKDDVVLLAWGYGDQAGRIAVVRLDDDRTHRIGNLSFVPPAPGTPGLVQGRGDTMHFVTKGAWSKLPVDRAVQAIA